MKGTIETPRVAAIIMSLITHLFYDVMLTLEKDSSNQVVYGKQLDIINCMKSVQQFVLTHPYGIFHIELLDSLTRDIKNPMLTLKFQNFGNDIDNKIPMNYHIILDETYTTFAVYQSSIDGILIKLKV